MFIYVFTTIIVVFATILYVFSANVGKGKLERVSGLILKLPLFLIYFVCVILRIIFDSTRQWIDINNLKWVTATDMLGPNNF